MSLEVYQEGCKGCEPAIIDLETKRPLPPEHPAMQAIMRVWGTLHTADKQAWHEFTCQNSREPQIMAAVARINDAFLKEMNQ